MTFTQETAIEFAQNEKEYYGHYGHCVIRDRDTIKLLTTRFRSLRVTVDSLDPNIDTRMMAVFYCSTNSDTLFLSTLREHDLQKNNLTMQSDSCLWLEVKNAVCFRDKRFYDVFYDDRGL